MSPAPVIAWLCQSYHPLQARVIQTTETDQGVDQFAVVTVDSFAGHRARHPRGKGTVGGQVGAQQIVAAALDTFVVGVSTQISQAHDLPRRGVIAILVERRAPGAVLGLRGENLRHGTGCHHRRLRLSHFRIIWRAIQQIAQGKVAHPRIDWVRFQQPCQLLHRFFLTISSLFQRKEYLGAQFLGRRMGWIVQILLMGDSRCLKTLRLRPLGERGVGCADLIIRPDMETGHHLATSDFAWLDIIFAW